MSSQHNKRVKYSPSKMSAAIQMVKCNGMAKAKAAKLFGVPRSTLQDKLAGRVPEEPTRPGPSPVLTAAEERTLVSYAKLMAEIGYPLTKKELLHETKRILDIDGRKTVFPNNLPGKGWYKAFKSRNPELVERTPAALGYHRACINMSMIQGWYNVLFKFLQDEVKNYKELIHDPHRVFNADESGFPICMKSNKVLALSGSRHVYQVLPGDKTQITVMACFNAFGEYMPPLIVYPGQRFRDTILSGFPEAIFGTSKNGWMDSELFISFLHHFNDFVNEKNIERPVILFVDGHSTHMSLPAATFCAEHNIILYCLLPNATHILQACDIGLFSPMKTKWRQMVKQWQMVHLGEAFTKTHFPEVFKSTWGAVANLSNSVSAFRRSGLFPLTPDGIDQSKLSPSKALTIEPFATSTITSPVASSEIRTFRSDAPLSTQSGVHNCIPVSSDMSAKSDIQACVPISSPLSYESSIQTFIPVSAQSGVQTCMPVSAQSGVQTCMPVSVQSGVQTCIPVSAQSGIQTCLPVNCNTESSVSAENTGVISSQVNAVTYTYKTSISAFSPSDTNHSSELQSGFASLPTYVTSNVLTPKGDSNYVSPAFNLLRVPELKKKKSVNTLRGKLPKALSGSVALKLLKEREETKKREEEAKLARKVERERKKHEREEEKERKRRMRDVNKKIKLLKNRKQQNSDTDDSSEENIPYMDNSSDDEGVRCPVCLSGEGRESEWIGCEQCPLWWHIDCIGNEEFAGKSANELKNITFVCDVCQ